MTTTRVRPSVTTEEVWRQLNKASFAVVSHVTPGGEPRSSGVLYTVLAGRCLYTAVAEDSWKARHLADGGPVAVTVPVRRGGLLSLLAPIPPATISFHGQATLHAPSAAPAELAPLLPAERRESVRLLEIVPEGQFVLYGIGVPLPRMREPVAARARVPVG